MENYLDRSHFQRVNIQISTCYLAKSYLKLMPAIKRDTSGPDSNKRMTSAGAEPRPTDDMDGHGDPPYREPMELLKHIIFYCFVALTLGSAGVVVFHKRIIYSAFALLFTFFGVAALYLYLAADFLAASQVLIYVGGILTLIIFGVFLTTKITTLDIPQQTHQRYIALIPVGLIGVALFWMIYSTEWTRWTKWTGMDAAQPTTKALGKLLLTDYLVPFEVASMLLLAALIGAMRLARFHKMQNKE